MLESKEVTKVVSLITKKWQYQYQQSFLINLSPEMKTICMKCQTLFSAKSKKNISCLLKFAERMLKF